jgi:hypothetical protein
MPTLSKKNVDRSVKIADLLDRAIETNRQTLSKKNVDRSVKIADLVDRAIETNRQIKTLATSLDTDKTTLRTEALGLAEAGEDGRLQKVELHGDLGVATIAFPKDSPRFVKGADVRVLVEKLGKAVWSSLFEEVTSVQMKPEFEATLELLSAGEKKAVMKLIEMVPGTPSVTLPK